MFSQGLELTLNLAYTLAKQRRHEILTTEHLLLALVDNECVGEWLREQGASLSMLRQQLSLCLEVQVPKMPAERLFEAQPTLSVQRVIQRAIYQCQQQDVEVSGLHLLAAILLEDVDECYSVQLLQDAHINRQELLMMLDQATRTQEPTPFIIPPWSPAPNDYEEMTQEGQEEGCPLSQYTVNLNEQARMGQLDPVLCRDVEMDRAVQVLCRRSKNNPIFVGEAGVGKTALVEGLANRLVAGDVPKAIASMVIYALDLAALLAGTKYRGDFEKRLKSLLKALENRPHAVLFIDEIHTIIGTGVASGGTLDAANLLKPMLSRSQLRCIGATTYQEYKGFAQDQALARRFQRVDVAETTPEQTMKLLKQGLKARFEEHHQVHYTHEALQQAVLLSERYMPDRFLPDKAIDIIDEAGAYFRSVRDNPKKSITISKKDIEWMVSRMLNIPVAQLSKGDREKLRGLESTLKSEIFGQDIAIQSVVSAIKMNHAGLHNRERPMGCFLLTGPTGVGKTEIARVLAKHLGVKLLRYDMSEYMERHSSSQLIGAPAGYVGFEQGGRLTDDISKHPHAVLLLDEIEKAHPDVLNLLLQVMDYGFINDNSGRKVDCRHLILLMTSNAGASSGQSNMGFVNPGVENSDQKQAIAQAFTPEFRNRLDAWIPFNGLSSSVQLSVLEKFLTDLSEQLSEQKVSLRVTEGAKRWLLQHGISENLGARPMRRVIDEHIRQKIADELLFGDLAQGGSLHVSARQDQLKLQVSSKAGSRVLALAS